MALTQPPVSRDSPDRPRAQCGGLHAVATVFVQPRPLHMHTSVTTSWRRSLSTGHSRRRRRCRHCAAEPPPISLRNPPVLPPTPQPTTSLPHPSDTAGLAVTVAFGSIPDHLPVTASTPADAHAGNPLVPHPLHPHTRPAPGAVALSLPIAGNAAAAAAAKSARTADKGGRVEGLLGTSGGGTGRNMRRPPSGVRRRWAPLPLRCQRQRHRRPRRARKMVPLVDKGHPPRAPAHPAATHSLPCRSFLTQPTQRRRRPGTRRGD